MAYPARKVLLSTSPSVQLQLVKAGEQHGRHRKQAIRCDKNCQTAAAIRRVCRRQEEKQTAGKGQRAPLNQPIGPAGKPSKNFRPFRRSLSIPNSGMSSERRRRLCGRAAAGSCSGSGPGKNKHINVNTLRYFSEPATLDDEAKTFIQRGMTLAMEWAVQGLWCRMSPRLSTAPSRRSMPGCGR
jgi:hypothetical protein